MEGRYNGSDYKQNGANDPDFEFPRKNSLVEIHIW